MSPNVSVTIKKRRESVSYVWCWLKLLMKYKDKYRQVWCLLLILLMKCKRNAKTNKSTRRQYNTMSGLLIQLVCQVRGCLTGREGKTFCWANLCSFWHRQQRKHWLQGKFIYINIKLFPSFSLPLYFQNFPCLIRSSCWPLQCPRRGVLRKNWDGLSDFMIRTARVAIELLINLLIWIFFSGTIDSTEMTEIITNLCSLEGLTQVGGEPSF